MGIIPSKKERAKNRGDRILGGCPFCDGEIGFYYDRFECVECDGKLVTSNSLPTGNWECVSGPDQYIGETKHRDGWSNLTVKEGDSESTEATKNSTDKSSRSSIELIQELKELHDDGIITDDEFKKKKQDILNEL
ncbi:SHOCT domain-containing protein [Halopenitus sp. POP-27]|uniref:SHOCT domain-containing protein n=1 Tax=Halopenitus sp. POP-27 TaxID=2994425 RepID=UPI002469831F|nr:SHOCT domain-containing protein [Halopenitus sp. POP-27]